MAHVLRPTVEGCLPEPMVFIQRLVDEFAELVSDAEGAGVALAASDGVLHYVATAGQMAPFKGFRIPITNSLHGRALSTGIIQVTEDAAQDPRVDRAAANLMGLRSLVAVPVLGPSGPVGVFTLTSSRPSAFTRQEVERLGSLIGFISTTISAASDVLAGEPADDGECAKFIGSGQTASITQFVSRVIAPAFQADAGVHTQIGRMIREKAFHTVLQPIVNMVDGRVVGGEALTRFEDATAPPGDWFAAAEKVGLGTQLEYATAISALSMLDRLPDALYLSFNSGPSMAFDHSLEQLVEAYDPRRIIVELTEHIVIEDYERLSEALKPVRDAGVRLAIDDSGAGFASLTHILKLAPDVIKIDRGLVDGIDNDPARRILASALGQLGRELGALVIAEGVQTESEASTLMSLGINHAQGFLFAHPGPVESIPLRVRPLGGTLTKLG